MEKEEITIPVSGSVGSVTGELMGLQGADLLYVFAHGAGAGMHHPFMVRLSSALAEARIATLRYQFPYMEKGARRPDPPAVATKTALAAISLAAFRFPGVPLIAGGKSFGGRMTSQSLSSGDKTPVRGLVFVGFPLHPAGKPGTERAEHLARVPVPMLFLQGTRDALADIGLIRAVCKQYQNATRREFEGADHSFKAGKADLIPALAQAIRAWADTILRNGTDGNRQ